MRFGYLSTFLVLLAGVFCSYGQSPDLTYSIIFAYDSDKVDLGLSENKKTIDELLDSMNEIYNDTTKVMTKIVIDSYSSPEGGVSYNKKLSERRSDSMYDYISTRSKFKRNIYDIKGTGINWDLLTELVEASDMDYKGEVLNILKYTPEETWKKLPNNSWKTLVDSRNKQLMDLKGGVPYNYMRDHFFSKLRVGSALSLYYENKYPKNDTIFVDRVDTVYEKKTEYVKVMTPAATPEKSILFALKTNLLSDLAIIPNIELEIPIGERFSANAEFAYIWMSSDSSKNNWCYQLQNYGVEGRYWFGDRSERSQLTGFFGGLYFSRTTFDMQLKSDRGMQAEIGYSLGVSGGYAIPLNDHFNMEFSAAVGYINGTTDKYTIEDATLVRRVETEKISTIFPTKAKVSLVWLINK